MQSILRVWWVGRGLCYAGEHLKTADFPSAMPSAGVAKLREAGGDLPVLPGWSWRVVMKFAVIAALLAGLGFVEIGRAHV